MIDKLEFLIAIARERNFRRAAETCGVAQPTLSAALKSLEEQLGVQLVRRTSRFVGMTLEGERVLDWARRIAADARAMRQEVRSLRRELVGELRLAAIPTAEPFTPALTRRYRVLHPGVRISVLSRSSDEILEELDELTVEAGITYIDNEAIGRLQVVPLYVERYVLVTGSNGALSARDSVRWEDVAALPLCMLVGAMQNRRILDRLLQPHAAGKPACMLEADTVLTLLAHVRTGEWATVVSEETAKLLAGNPPFRAMPIEGADTAFSVGLVVPDRQPMTPVLDALLHVARKTTARP